MTFDYVIVGGGSAGSTLAARLSENPSISVCLLEAGGDGKDLLIRAPVCHVKKIPQEFAIAEGGEVPGRPQLVLA